MSVSSHDIVPRLRLPTVSLSLQGIAPMSLFLHGVVPVSLSPHSVVPMSLLLVGVFS